MLVVVTFWPDTREREARDRETRGPENLKRCRCAQVCCAAGFRMVQQTVRGKVAKPPAGEKESGKNVIETQLENLSAKGTAAESTPW